MAKQKTVGLIVSKPFRYATRRLAAGDLLTVPEVVGHILVHRGRARPADAVTAPPAGLAAKVRARAGADVGALRASYTRLAGKKPFNGWDEATLREKITALGG